MTQYSALKKIKLLQEGKTSTSKAAPAASNLASRVNFNADKVHAKADRLIFDEKPKTKVPENFFDDKKEMEAKKDQIQMDTDPTAGMHNGPLLINYNISTIQMRLR